MFRHGDVLILPTHLPKGAAPEPRSGDIILAHGEVTGHAHRIKDTTARIFVVGNARYLVTERPSDLTHEEHNTITLPQGAYEVRIQRTYTPAAIVRVVD